MKSAKVRFWIEVLALVGAIACCVALFIAAAGMGTKVRAKSEEPQAPVQSSAVPQQTYDGVITDTHCGAKHSTAIADNAADCTRVCVHAGERFALVDGEKMWVLQGDPAALKHAAGERVKITGTLSGNTISVTSVRAPVS